MASAKTNVLLPRRTLYISSTVETSVLLASRAVSLKRYKRANLMIIRYGYFSKDD